MLRRSASRDGHPYRAPTDGHDTATETTNARLAARAALRTALLRRLGGLACVAAALTLGSIAVAYGTRPPPAAPHHMRIAAEDGAKDFAAEHDRPRVRFGVQPRAMSVDINRDRTRDFFVYGLVDGTPPLGFLAAVDGAKLRPIWTTKPSRHSGYALPIATAGDHVFFGDNSGRVQVHDLTTGELVSESLAAPGWHLCRRADSASVWIESDDRQHATYGVTVDTSGRTVEAGPRPAACDDAWRAREIHDQGPDSRVWRMFEADDQTFGFGVDIAARKPIETVVMFQPKNGRGHRWTERYYLGGDDGPTIDIQGYEVDEARFYFAYRLSDGTRRIGARSRLAGNLVWTQTSERHSGAAVQGVSASDHLLVVAETHLELRELETGKQLAALRGGALLSRAE